MLPTAVIVLDFDPTLTVGAYLIRWETLALAAAILFGLVLTAILAGRANRSGLQPTLRRDDILYLVIAGLPGAVVGGRVVHGLEFAAFYATDPGALLEVGRGSLSLFGAVLGGCLSGAYVARLIGAPVRRWLDVATVPLLLVIGLGKLAGVLGGTGQGAPSDLPWALAFAGSGPWRSLAPEVPAHPSQVYEGLWVLAGVAAVGFFARRWVPRPGQRWVLRPGLLFGVGLAWWALGRVVVGSTWRAEAVLGGLNLEQLLALAVFAALGAALLLVALWVRRPVGARTSASSSSSSA